MRKVLVLISSLVLVLNTFGQFNCNESTSNVELDVNNVRAMLLNGGDMFSDVIDTWDQGYEVPKGGGNHSFYGGGLWIGGEDSNGDIYVTAQTYRQGKYSYWPGPLNYNSSNNSSLPSINSVICGEWDTHFSVRDADIDDFITAFAGGSIASINDIDSSILFWPAKNNPYSSISNLNQDLAPFVDVNSDGNYNPMDGDYPDIIGDQSVWWVMNDVGNEKTFEDNLYAINDLGIGLEIQVEAFAFATTDELNDVTFQKYTIINKGYRTLYDTYAGMWVDVDLGFFVDDYVGCNPSKNLAYGYNSDNYDGLLAGDSIAVYNGYMYGPVGGYGYNVPAVGVSVCKGMIADSGDNIDNDRDGAVDEQGEEILMSNFMIYNNNANPVNGNPFAYQNHYNYLKSLWRNGDNITRDNLNGLEQSFPQTDFMYDGNPILDTGWTEITAGNAPGDRRFLMSMGPFTLAPGEEKEFIIAIPWAQDTNGAMAALQKLFDVTDKVKQVCDADFSGYTAIKEKIKTQSIGKVYPTLVDDFLTIELKRNEAVKVDFFNALGEQVFSEKINNSQKIEFPNVESGIYFYKISSLYGVQTGKLIKK